MRRRLGGDPSCDSVVFMYVYELAIHSRPAHCCCHNYAAAVQIGSHFHAMAYRDGADGITVSTDVQVKRATIDAVLVST